MILSSATPQPRYTQIPLGKWSKSMKFGPEAADILSLTSAVVPFWVMPRFIACEFDRTSLT